MLRYNKVYTYRCQQMTNANTFIARSKSNETTTYRKSCLSVSDGWTDWWTDGPDVGILSLSVGSDGGGGVFDCWL